MDSETSSEEISDFLESILRQPGWTHMQKVSVVAWFNLARLWNPGLSPSKWVDDLVRTFEEPFEGWRDWFSTTHPTTSRSSNDA